MRRAKHRPRDKSDGAGGAAWAGGVRMRSVVVGGALLLVGLGVHEAVHLRGVAQPQLDHPAVAEGVLVHLRAAPHASAVWCTDRG